MIEDQIGFSPEEETVKKIVPDWAIELLGGSKLVEKKISNGAINVSYVQGGGGVVGEHLKKQGTEGYGWILEPHGRLVFRAAYWVAGLLKKQGVEVDLNLVATAALLHDASGRRRFEEMMRNKEWGESRPLIRQKLNDYGHGRLGEGLVRAKTYKIDKEFGLKVAKVIRVHDRTVPNPVSPTTIEEKIVLWADHVGDINKEKTGLVDLQERFLGIHKRWVDTGRMTEESFSQYKALIESIQDEIFEVFGGNLKPSDVPFNPIKEEEILFGQIKKRFDK